MEPVKAAKLLYGVAEAAEVIDVGRTTMFDLIASGEIESVKIGRSRKIPHSALIAYVERLRGAQAARDAR